MRRDDQAIDLLIAVISQREHRPICVGFPGAHLDAANDPVRTGRSRNLHAIAIGVLVFDGSGEIDGEFARLALGRNVDCFDSVCGRHSDRDRPQQRQYAQGRGGTERRQWMPSNLGTPTAPQTTTPNEYRTGFTPNSRPSSVRLPARCGLTA
jgi:hypothetical protein